MTEFEMYRVNESASKALVSHCVRNALRGIVASTNLESIDGELVLTLSIGQNLFKSEMRITKEVSAASANVAVKQFIRTIEGKSQYQTFKHYARHWEFKNYRSGKHAA